MKDDPSVLTKNLKSNVAWLSIHKILQRTMGPKKYVYLLDVEKLPKTKAESLDDEEFVKLWLEARGFKIEKWHNRKASNEPWDIIALKGGKKYILDVKRRIQDNNFLKNLNRVDFADLAILSPENKVYLLICDKKET